jgi:hypothetical protein
MSFFHIIADSVASATETLKIVNSAMEGKMEKGRRRQEEYRDEQRQKRTNAVTRSMEATIVAREHSGVVLPTGMTRQLVTVINATLVALNAGNFSLTAGQLNMSNIVALAQLIERLNIVSSQLENHCNGVAQDPARWPQHAKSLEMLKSNVIRAKKAIAFHQEGFRNHSSISLMKLDYL